MLCIADTHWQDGSSSELVMVSADFLRQKHLLKLICNFGVFLCLVREETRAPWEEPYSRLEVCLKAMTEKEKVKVWSVLSRYTRRIKFFLIYSASRVCSWWSIITKSHDLLLLLSPKNRISPPWLQNMLSANKKPCLDSGRNSSLFWAGLAMHKHMFSQESFRKPDSRQHAERLREEPTVRPSIYLR